MKPDYTVAVQFLERFHPDRLWVVTVIHPDRPGTTTRTFDKRSASGLLTCLRERGRSCNIYFSVGEPTGPLNEKASRSEIEAVHWLHVDLDPRVGEDLVEERTRILALLRDPSGLPKPTTIVFSGGGYQGFWQLEEPITIDGDLAAAEDAARYNKQIELQLGGDNCHDVSRIMRLPGTINRPDKRKRKKGRTEAVAELVEWHEDRIYPISEFAKAEEVQSNGVGFTPTAQISGNVKRLASVDELPKAVSGKCREVIVQGKDLDDPNRWASRSEPLFWVCCSLVRAGCDDDTIYSVITDPDFKISESVLEKRSGAKRYALRQIERAREEAVDPVLREFNDEYAVIGSWGGKCRILEERIELVGEVLHSRINFKTFADFHNQHSNKYVEIVRKVRNKDVAAFMPAGKWWTTHPMRRTYRSVLFAPGREVPDVYNLWRGFSCEARPGDCSLYLEHVKVNICGGEERLYNYVIGWMAMAVQRPAQPGHTAIVLRGRQGTGKGVFAQHFGALFGRHFLPVRDSSHLFGHFNAHLRDCVVLFADEAFWAGNKKHEGLLKSLITEDAVMVEAKGIDAETSSNYVHLIMASNEDWVVPTGTDDRRFLVMDVGDIRMQDTGFFGDLKKQMAAGGYEALLHLLLTYDISEFDVRAVPQTAALQDQKVSSLSYEQEWWFDKLQTGRILETDDRWPSIIFVADISYNFTTYRKTWGGNRHGNSTRLGRFMLRTCPEGHDLRKRLAGRHSVTGADGMVTDIDRPHVYVLPPLDVCRKHWDDHFGGPYTWSDLKTVKGTSEQEEGF